MSILIQVSELHFTTEAGIKVLEDVHLHIERGEFVVLVGPPSAGKSLLLGLLGAQISPQQGQILVHGRNVARLGPGKALALRRQIGYVPHGFTPLSRTTIENVLFKLRSLGDFKEQAQEKALVALESVGLLRNQASEVAELSSLERVRLSLALAICDDPLLLLLDGLFDELGSDEQEDICSALDRLHDGGTTILVATRGPLPAPLRKHRVLSLVDGRVVPG